MIIPVDVPLVTAGQPAQTDATGSFQSTTMVHPANWSVVRLVGLAVGNPNWVLNSDNNLPLDFASGPKCSMGLVLVAPGQRLTTQITVAQPSTGVSAHLVGVMSPDLEEVLPFYLPSPNPIGSTITAPRVLLQTITVAGGGVSPQTNIPLPAGTQSVGILANSQPAAPANVQILGHLTGDTIYNTAPGLVFRQRPVATEDEVSIDVTVTAQAVLGCSVAFFAVFAPNSSVHVSNDGAEPVPVTNSGAGATGVLTVQEGTVPPPWQAARSSVQVGQVVGNGVPFTVIAGVANQIIYLHSVNLAFDAASVGNDLQLQDGATNIGRISGISQTPGNQEWHGRPLTSGNAFNIVGNGANFTVRGTVTYSQA